MKKFFFLALSILSISMLAQDRPKLVVGIVVDQMRQDYLFRFSEKFGEGGFKRLMNEGHQFKNAHYNYVPTYTAPGHASIYTGTTPSNHSIIANGWYDKAKERSTYCVSDETVSAVGGSEQAGKMSPRNLKASTITDELLLTTNFRSKVVGVSIKDRGSILPAGHNPTGAYWFDSKSGNFMTSTYYTESLPKWAKNFNKKRLVNEYLKNTWETLLPISEYVESTADDVPYEQAFRGQEKAVFPYKLDELVKDNGIGIIRTTPYGNSIVLDMALAAIEGEQIGADAITDFLAVSFSSTDYVGHAFGPNSIELEDTYLRLDQEIKRLLDYLDANFSDEYVVFLSSDHGVVEVPLYLEDQKMVGGYLNQSRIKSMVNAIYGASGDDLVKSISNDQIFLNYDWINEKELKTEDVRQTLKAAFLSIDEVAKVYTANEIILGNSTDPIKQRLKNGYNMKMSGDLLVMLKPGYLTNSGYGKAGTTHGSGYTYDTHVPILFYGKGVKSGTTVRQVSITDIAPTLSMLLNISLPNSSTGQPLEELFATEK